MAGAPMSRRQHVHMIRRLPAQRQVGTLRNPNQVVRNVTLHVPAQLVLCDHNFLHPQTRPYGC